MALDAKMDENSRQTLTALSSTDHVSIVQLYADPVTHRLLTDAAGGTGTVTNIATGAGLTGGPITTTGTIALNSKLSPLDTLGTPGQAVRVNGAGTALEYFTIAGTGTVTSVSVASANGFTGTVANATTTPAITLTTSITGVLKGNGTAISAASDGTDYLSSTTGVTLAQGTAQTIGTTTNRVLKLWATDITVTNAIAGSVTGNAGTVTNGVYTTDVTTTATANKIVQRDANANIFTNNQITGYATTATAAGTTTLTVGSAREQFFTGTTTQTVVLPDATTLALGFQFRIHNNSTGLVTVQDSGTSTVWILGAMTDALFTCTNIGSAAGVWDAHYMGIGIASGKKVSFANSLLFSGTDGSTLAIGTGGTLGTAAYTATTAYDVAGAAAAVTPTSLGLVIGTNVQAYDADLTTWAGITPGANVGTALAVAVGSAGAFVTFNGAGGTPSSLTLTNATGLPIAGLVSSTSTALGVGSLELGHATDTTLSRVSAGVMAVEGVTVPTISSTSTLTNKRITKRAYNTTNLATLTPEIDTYDDYEITALAQALTIANHSTSTPVQGDVQFIMITPDATPRALTFGTDYVAKAGVALPTTTVASKSLSMIFRWSAGLSKYVLLATGQE